MRKGFFSLLKKPNCDVLLSILEKRLICLLPILIQEVSIGSWTIIGAGAAVVGNIPEKVVAVGVPAKVIKKIIPQSE